MTPYNSLSHIQKEKIIKEYYKMEPFENISSKLSVSRRSVSRVLKESGINTCLKNRYTLSEDFFETIDSEEKAYWLGFIYADGYVGDDRFNNLVLSSIDKEHIVKFKETIKFTGQLRVGSGGYPGSGENLIINFSSAKMTSDLRNKGLYPGKSTTMESFPELEDFLIRHFIRGYFDGDGSVYSSRNTSYHKGKMYEYQIPTVSIIGTKPFIEELSNHLVFKNRIRKSKSKNMVYLEYSKKEDIPNIFQYLYNDSTVYMERKFNKFKELLAPL